MQLQEQFKNVMAGLRDCLKLLPAKLKGDDQSEISKLILFVGNASTAGQLSAVFGHGLNPLVTQAARLERYGAAAMHNIFVWFL